MNSTIDQLLARAEQDLEIASRRREIAAALAADWAYWSRLLNGGTAPAEAREATVLHADMMSGQSADTAASQYADMASDRDTRKAVSEAPLLAAAAAPVLQPAAPQSTCRMCGGPITPRHNGRGSAQVYCSPACRIRYNNRPRQTGRPRGRPRKSTAPEPAPLPDLIERPFSMGEFEEVWLKETLRPPHLAIEEPLR